MSSQKDNSIVIEAPRQGIAQSPHVGFGSVVNLDITSVQGVAQLNTILVKKSGSTVTALVNWLVRHPITTTEVYALDAAGTVYKSTDSSATWSVLSGSSSTSAHGNGLWIWKNYLFVARDAYLDVCGDGTATGITAANWSLGWKSIDSDVLWHPMLTSKNDGKLYGGAGRFVYSLEENTGYTFAPGTAATFTWTQQALDLPSSYRIKCIAELGNNLMLGTWQGTNIYDIRVADIFPWDRSAVSFGAPLQMGEYGVHAMINILENLYVLAGIGGTVYRSDGVNAVVIAQLPQDLSGGKYIEFYPGSIASYKKKLFFGVGQGGSTAIPEMGVYSVEQTGRGSVLNLEHTISTLNDGSVNPLKVTALLPISRDTISVAWRDNSSYGIDLASNTSYAYTTDYSGYFTSPIYKVGSIKNLRTFEEIEFELAKKLVTGQGIKLQYRTNTTDSFSDIGTFEFSTLGGVVSHWAIPKIPACEMVQIRCMLKGSSTTTPQLKNIILR